MMNYIIEEMSESHWEQVSQIYLEGINTNKATFQSTVPTWNEWNNSHIKTCRLVAISNDTILGWTALSPTSSRCVYAGVAEVSIYISKKYRGIGVGTTLLNELIIRSEKAGFWTLQSGIIAKNTESISLHKRCGFNISRIREKIAKMNNSEWLDVVLMERRSTTVGIN